MTDFSGATGPRIGPGLGVLVDEGVYVGTSKWRCSVIAGEKKCECRNIHIIYL